MTRFSLTNPTALLVILSLLAACSEQSDAPAPTAAEIYIDSERYGHIVEKIEIKQGDLIIREIQLDTDRWEGEAFGPVQIKLPYEWTSWAADEPEEAFAAWDSIVTGGPLALVVQEYVSGGSAPGSHRWVMRIFLWEDGALRELPPIPGAGGVYYFKDLNHDGSVEFVNQEGLSSHDLSADGLPLSPRVYRFNGERYEPVTDKETWPEVRARIDEAYRSKDPSN